MAATKIRYVLWAACVVFALCVMPRTANAACADPVGGTGDIIWAAASNLPAYCNGTDWVAFPKGVDAGGGGVYEVSVNVQSGCAIMAGVLSCWGSNGVGTAGQGNTSAQPTPARVGTDSDWMKIVTHDFNTCGIRAPGSLYCWGERDSGITGETIAGLQTTPLQVGTDTGWSAASLAIGDTGDPTACGIMNGGLYCWGYHNNGLTGQGLTTGKTHIPAQVGSDTDWTKVSISGGNTSPEHGCGIRAPGMLYCWGQNQYGGTALGTTTGTQTTPARVGTDSDWTDISVSPRGGCGVRAGRLYCWGNNVSPSSSSPTQVGADTDWASVSSRQGLGYGLCAVKQTGTLYCRTYGYESLSQVGSDTDWVMIDLGYGISASLVYCGFRNTTLYCWGTHEYYSTGQGVNSGSQASPTQTNAITAASTACLNPAGNTGDILYNATSHVLQYCDGNNWFAAGAPGDGGAGCANPSGVAGDIVFNSTSNVLQYCEGDAWFEVGSSDGAMAPPPPDTTPNAFSFTDQTSVAVSTLITSNSINITGIDAAASVSVSGDGSPQVRINGGSWVTSGTITSGQSLEVRLTSSASASTMRSATVTVGGVSDQWDVTTGAGGCGGTLAGGYCFYPSAEDQSCNSVCSGRGGCNATGNTWTNASDANCVAALNAAGLPAGVMFFSDNYGGFIGCVYDPVGNVRVRDTSGTSCGIAFYFRACACNN